MEGRTGWAVRIASNVAALFATALAAAEWGGLWAATVHVGVFYSTAAMSAALIFFGREVFGKLDKVQESTEKYDRVRTERAYRYTEQFRKRLFSWLCASLLAILVCGACGYVLRHGVVADARAYIIAGYLGLCTVLLATLRMATGYLSLAQFRLQLLTAMDREQKRADAMKSLDASAILPDISSAPPMTITTGR